MKALLLFVGTYGWACLLFPLQHVGVWGHLSGLSHGADSRAANVFGISGRDGLGHFVAAHPVDAHGFRAAIGAHVAGYRDEAAIGPMCAPVFAAAVNSHDVLGVRRLLDREAAFKKPMPIAAQPEHGAAQHQVVAYRGARHVFDHKRRPIGRQARTDRLNQIGVAGQVFPRIERTEPLAGRRRPYEIEACQRVRQRVRLTKLEWIAGLRVNIDAGYVEASPAQSFGRAASAAKKVKGFRECFHGRLSSTSTCGRQPDKHVLYHHCFLCFLFP